MTVGPAHGAGLQGGTRRPRRSRRAGLARLTGLIVVVAFVVALLTAGGEDVAWHAAGGHERPASSRPRPTRSDQDPYGVLAAAPARRVRARFDHPPRAGLLFDLRTGRVLWRLHTLEQRSIASLTKMMTALVTVERERPDARVLITPTALRYQGSGVGLLPRGRRVPLEDLLYGLLLPSGNDAARALAEHVAGSIPRFAGLMNERARQLGLTCTHFVGPDGYDDANRSCARDLARLGHAVLAQPRLRRIVRTPYAARPFPIKSRKLYLASHNPLYRLGYRGWSGIKTGYSEAAGLCFVGSARRGAVELGVVLLDSPSPGAQAAKLLDRGFAALGARRPAPA